MDVQANGIVSTDAEKPSRIPAERPVTVRLPVGDVQLLQGLAVLDDNTVASQIRTAVQQYTDDRLADPDLPAQIRSAEDRHAAVFRALEGSAPGSVAASKPASTTRSRGTKALTLRISSQQLEWLQALSLLDENGTVADQLRRAVAYMLSERLDTATQRSIDDMRMEQDRLFAIPVN